MLALMDFKDQHLQNCFSAMESPCCNIANCVTISESNIFYNSCLFICIWQRLQAKPAMPPTTIFTSLEPDSTTHEKQHSEREYNNN